MNCKEIIKKYLIDNGYDGLQNEAECGCKLDDLIPCDGCFDMCTAGYIPDCSKCDNKDNCELGFCIGSNK